MNDIDFSKIANVYEKYSLVQKSAAEILLGLLEIQADDDVLDIGCGAGNLTRKIREISKGRVVGIDISAGMINKAIENTEDLDITFEIRSAEEMDYRDRFDVIFSNSSFQWFKDIPGVIRNCRNALRKGGRIGIQAPARRIYSPNFIKAIEKVEHDPATGDIFSHFRNPWFFLETSDEYRDCFEKSGFEVIFSKIEQTRDEYTPEQVFNIFSSGAIAGYLNRDNYTVKIDAGYVETFKKIIREAFLHQSDDNGKIGLVFNRIFLVAVK